MTVDVAGRVPAESGTNTPAWPSRLPPIARFGPFWTLPMRRARAKSVPTDVRPAATIRAARSITRNPPRQCTDPVGSVCDRSPDRAWVDNAVRLIEADARRSADTHLLRYPLPTAWCDTVDVALYLKDETTHITGSLKHRLARSLFLYALCNGWIDENTTVIEASSRSTAVSEAYFAALLGLPFIAVITSPGWTRF